jgi:putative PIN family toxin of toxin-antitoxin system
VRCVAVFDTNVLISGVGWKGKPGECIELARSSQVEGVTCPELLQELSERLEAKLSLEPTLVVKTVADLLLFLRVITIAGQLTGASGDPDDDIVLECAVAAGATHIVTGDKRHLLPLGSFQGIRIVTPAQFLAAVRTP